MSEHLVYRRLKWQCRRGHLELDLVLHDFLERDYSSSTADEREAFARLLTVPDSVLLKLLFPLSGKEGDNRGELEQNELMAGLESIVEKLQQKTYATA